MGTLTGKLKRLFQLTSKSSLTNEKEELAVLIKPENNEHGSDAEETIVELKESSQKSTELLSITKTENQNEGTSLILADEQNPWFVIGASVTGNGHKHLKIPCQDAHRIELWGNGWGVAAVSDGAGSAKKSHDASAFLVEEATRQAFELVNERKWKEDDRFPDQNEWKLEARKLFDQIQDKLVLFAKEHKTPLSDLHATLIMIVFSPMGLMAAHIGDGRAGYLDEKNEWHSIMIPFEGEQVGETAFITLDFQKHDFVFETRVVNGAIKSFFLLSDGCEKVCWETIVQDPETGTFSKPNKPFEPFFEQTIGALMHFQKTESKELLMQKWYNYLENGHPGFQAESDDKTMVVAINTETEFN